MSGIGISRIGCRTGIPCPESDHGAAVRAAIDDAGLVAADIDGIATLGETPAQDVTAELRIDAADCGSGFGTGGLLSPVMSACRAVASIAPGMWSCTGRYRCWAAGPGQT